MKSVNNWHFLTFGAGSWTYRRSARRLTLEAQKFQLFGTCDFETEHTLSKKYPGFFMENEEILKPEIQGFGYWIWKPFLILEHLKNMKSTDGLMYLDSGSTLNLNAASRNRLKEYLNIAENKNSLLFRIAKNDTDVNFAEENWTSSDLLDKLNLNELDRKSSQTAGGVIFLLSNENNIALIENWLELCKEDNYRFLKPNKKTYIVANNAYSVIHRHDQSILSCLQKKSGLYSIWNEIDFAPNWQTEGSLFPIWTNRNRTGISAQKHSINDFPDRIAKKYFFLKHQLKIGIKFLLRK